MFLRYRLSIELLCSTIRFSVRQQFGCEATEHQLASTNYELTIVARSVQLGALSNNNQSAYLVSDVE